jgi:hypothetical protein
MHAMTRKKVASYVWPRFSSSLDTLNRNSQMFAALREYQREPVQKCADRAQMYMEINKRLANCAITYLEFGVWRGESLELWSRLNTNAASRFYGFDSFEGLPEEWDHGFGSTTSKERFDVCGVLPRVTDVRIKLIKGWFQHTLRQFLRDTELPHPIVVHIDSDLHSSALYTLCTLDPLFTSGDIVVFDEYTSPSNEFLAWEEYKRAFMRSADCIAMGNRWCQVAFQMSS